MSLQSKDQNADKFGPPLYLTDDNPAVINGMDFGLTVEQLEVKYSQCDHPDHIREDWRNDVSQGDTNIGYWEWVSHQVESLYHDTCDDCGRNTGTRCTCPS